MSFGNLSHDDVSPQQFWGSSRSLGGDHSEDYHDCRELDKAEIHKNMALPPRPGNQLNAPMPILLEDESRKGKEQLRESEDEDQHLLGNEEGNNRAGCPPTWLSSALLRQQNQPLDDAENGHDGAEKWCPICSANGSQSCMCGTQMHAGDTNATPFLAQSTYSHWLSMQGTMHAPQHRQGELHGNDDGFGVDRHHTRMATDLNLSAAQGRDAQRFLEFIHPSLAGSGYDGDYGCRTDWGSATQRAEWEETRNRAMIVNHPLYPELLMAHAVCLRIGTPVDQLPSVETQLSQAQNVIQKYTMLHPDQLEVTPGEKMELDRFMTEYISFLDTFKEILQHHVYTDVTEAMMSCWELEQALHTLTGVTPSEGTGATMSDEDEEYDSDYGTFDQSMDYGHDSGGYGPLVPTEIERSLMERVRQELKCELKQGYRSKIEDVREEILRKRRAGKLPEGTTTVLKAWWQEHSK